MSKYQETPREPMLSVRDVAQRLGCGQRKAREIMLGMRHTRVGKLLRVDGADLEAWRLAGGDDYERRQVSAHTGRTAPSKRGPPPVIVPRAQSILFTPVRKRPAARTAP